MFSAAMCIEIQPAVEVLAEDGEQRFVEPPVGRAADRVAQVDPNAVAHTVAVVVNVPRAAPFPIGKNVYAVGQWRKNLFVWITSSKLWMVFFERTQTD